MACYFIENIHTSSFTPKEFQVELLDACREGNTIVCLSPGSNRTFVTLKLLQELSIPTRRPWHCGGKRSLFIGSKLSVHYYAELIKQLTDLSVGVFKGATPSVDFEEFQVVVADSEVCAGWSREGLIPWSRINLVILEDCHNTLRNHPLREIVLSLRGAGLDEGPRLLGLTWPLFTSARARPGSVEAQLNQLEIDLSCKVETSSDIVSILRFNARPKELLLECSENRPSQLRRDLEYEISDLVTFLDDHRYDPSEIYDDSFLEELKDVPDPKKDPYEIINDFLEVLDTMGPWCADKAALVLLVQIEKLKVKTPYERHFLLLCIVSSVLLKIRAICDNTFQDLSEVEKIKRYSSPKILRLIEVIRQFKPNVSHVIDNPNDVEIYNDCSDICKLVDSSPSDCVKFDLSSDSKTNDDLTPTSSGFVENFNGEDQSLSDGFTNPKNPCQVHCDKSPTCNKNSLPSSELCFVCGKIDCSGSTEVEAVDTDKGDGTVGKQSTGTNGTLENGISPSTTPPLTNGNHDSSPASGTSPLKSAVSNDPKNEEPKGNEVAPTNRAGGRWRGRGRGWRQRKGTTGGKNVRHQNSDDPDNLCGIIFVQKRFTAKILYHLFHDLHRCDPDFANINVQYTVDKTADPISDPREAEVEHKKQEDVLKRFRMRECNLVIATSVLEEGMELPKCNLVVRYDPVSSYRSHAYSKGRAKHQYSFYISLVQEETLGHFLQTYAQHKCIEQLLLKRSNNHEVSESEEKDADLYTECVPPYRPLADGPYVDLSSSLPLVNRYCAKLPSDTFTRLTPLWSMHEVHFRGRLMSYCTLRLPINSPVKENILGHPMPTRALARRVAALETCRLLHLRGELDNNLEPIGKESFNSGFDEEDLSPVAWDPDLPRPGTTKSRQYYYKRIASCLNDCRPVTGEQCYLYNVDMVLTCPLPEEQNTRGRKLHPPELAPQAFGILTMKQIPKICPFPIFTRSGEVQVSLRLCSTRIVLSERHVQTISTFLNFIFTSVLRLQKYLMSFDPEATENSFFIVPTKKNVEGVSEVDWDFLEVIYSRKDECPHLIPDEARKDYTFQPERYKDAVVMPWYRNQDQPQYFYVAEICHHLNPKSGFPGSAYNTFEDYYLKKYNIQIQNTSQPLLDVDHTSARLNFLTPRYVNRKGVALPTSSEETKRAKRENLEQKQILVGELCQVHVVPASLWRQAVCLPCILYRLNALLLADEIRTKVAAEVNLGLVHLPKDFEWAPLDFGWSLADVLNKSKKDGQVKSPKEIENAAPSEENNVGTEKIDESSKDVEGDSKVDEEDKKKVEHENKTEGVGKSDGDKKEDDKDSDGLTEEEEGAKNGEDGGLDEGEEEDKDENWMEIGTWSNDMAQLANDLDKDLPPELSMVRYGSPTSWDVLGDNSSFDYYSSEGESDDSDEGFLESETSGSSDSGVGRLKITFKGDYLAEAVEDDVEVRKESYEETDSAVEPWTWDSEDLIPQVKDNISDETKLFESALKESIEEIKDKSMLIRAGEPLVVERQHRTSKAAGEGEVETRGGGDGPPPGRGSGGGRQPGRELPFRVEGYGMPEGLLPSPVSPAVGRSSPTQAGVQSQTMLSTSEGEDKDLFSFDAQPELEGHPGPSPSILLQALTMSNANDGINLERLETIGDSFLKYAITTYLYCSHENIHEGKLSHLRSKQVSNLKLYRLGQKKVFGESMIASKFEPHDNWLPPCYLVPRDAEQQLLDTEPEETLPYNLVTQHSIPDKSIADCVEALIGAYLIECGPRGALIFMSWLGIKVLPRQECRVPASPGSTRGEPTRPVGSLVAPDDIQVVFTELASPESPLLRHVPDPEGELASLLSGFEALESSLRYPFRDRSYLLQAMSHASYSPNAVTDCYQRLEFLGDAVLDYLITRHLFEDERAHSPGALTDLRSALVNNTIFASLAVKHGLHKYFRHLSPGLAEVVQRFVSIQEENSHTISEEFFLVGEEAEDVEVPKALGDVFESIAGAIFLDSGMSLDTVWKVYYRMMKKEIEQFSAKVPKSPIRELLELEPETAKFSKPEKLADGRRVRVTVEVFGKGTFKGIGRNYRIAKCTAAKCALKQLKIRRLLQI